MTPCCCRLVHILHDVCHNRIYCPYEQCSTLREGLLNKSFMSLSRKRCPGISTRRCARSKASPTLSSPSSSASKTTCHSPSKPACMRPSLHISSKLSPSIRMIRLCRIIQTRAHMMTIMWCLELLSWTHISFKDWNLPLSRPIVTLLWVEYGQMLAKGFDY